MGGAACETSRITKVDKTTGVESVVPFNQSCGSKGNCDQGQQRGAVAPGNCLELTGAATYGTVLVPAQRGQNPVDPTQKRTHAHVGAGDLMPHQDPPLSHMPHAGLVQNRAHPWGSVDCPAHRL